MALLAVQYVRTGSWRPGRRQSGCLWGLLGLLLAWGAARNLLGL